MPEPFRPDDDIVSAVLDGDATAAERARVAADPVLAARLAEFATVAGAVGTPVPTRSVEGRDAAIAAAVAEGRHRDPVVIPMAPRRSTRAFLAAAAAVLVVLLAAGVLADRLGGGDDTDAQSAGDTRADHSATGDGTAAEAAADAVFDGTGPVVLGTVADEDELRVALTASGGLDAFDATPTTRSTLPAPAAGPDAPSPVPGDHEACLVRLEEADPALDGVLLEGTVTYAGTDGVVYVFATVDGERRVVVVAADACSTLAAFPL